MPMRVMPSVTLRPVSVNVKTGALSVTEPGTSVGDRVLVSTMASVPGPEPPQAPKKKASAMEVAKREMT